MIKKLAEEVMRELESSEDGPVKEFKDRIWNEAVEACIYRMMSYSGTLKSWRDLLEPVKREVKT